MIFDRKIDVYFRYKNENLSLFTVDIPNINVSYVV